MASGLPLEWSVSRISNGTVPELHEVVELARRGDISLEVERIEFVMEIMEAAASRKMEITEADVERAIDEYERSMT